MTPGRYTSSHQLDLVLLLESVARESPVLRMCILNILLAGKCSGVTVVSKLDGFSAVLVRVFLL